MDIRFYIYMFTTSHSNFSLLHKGLLRIKLNTVLIPDNTIRTFNQDCILYKCCEISNQSQESDNHVFANSSGGRGGPRVPPLDLRMFLVSG